MMDIICSEFKRFEKEDSFYTPVPDGDRPGAVTLKFWNGVISHVIKTGALIHGACIDDDYLKLLFERKKIVKVGDYISGADMTGNSLQLKWNEKLESEAVPYLVDLTNRKLWPCLIKIVNSEK
jgi:hypothetical protein